MFLYDSNALKSVTDLIQQDVIVVSLNYRLGALGFLSLGNYQHSGNLGIRDQRLALPIQVVLHAPRKPDRR